MGSTCVYKLRSNGCVKKEFLGVHLRQAGKADGLYMCLTSLGRPHAIKEASSITKIDR